MCKDDTCFKACPDNDFATEKGCYCGKNGNICNKGQICQVVSCTYTAHKVLGLYYIIGLIIGLILMFCLCNLLNLLIK